MIVLDGPRRWTASLQCWFPHTPFEALTALARAPMVDVMQCTGAVAEALAPWAWRTRDFHTQLIDLTLDEATLYEAFEKRTCRYQLRKADKLAPEMWHLPAGAATTDAAAQRTERESRALIDAFIARRKYRAAMPEDEWLRLRAHADLFVVAHGGRAVSTHVTLVDGRRRARALISATLDRADGEGRALAGALNRWLHWSEMRQLRARGVAQYDFGGLVRDPNDPLHAIDQFKVMFGGTTVTERIVRLCRWSVPRAALRAAVSVRRRRHAGAALPEVAHGAA